MKNFFRYYLLITQTIVFMVAPPLVAWLICYKTKASSTALIVSTAIMAVLGVAAGILFVLRFIKKNEDRSELIKRIKERKAKEEEEAKQKENESNING